MLMDMKIIFAVVVAISVFLSVSPSFGQTINGIPAVNFICLQPEPIFDIMDAAYNRSPEAGSALADKYIENNECWHVNSTPVEIISILQESFDPEGKLWAVVAVKPHESTGFGQRLQRYAVVDAAIAKAYLIRHQTEI